MAQLSTLVIGYGNTIRSDDGAGQAVAEALATHALPGVRTQTVHQLTPYFIHDGLIRSDKL
jgi:Ni,Fe-hydrogenase maturation factor